MSFLFNPCQPCCRGDCGSGCCIPANSTLCATLRVGDSESISFPLLFDSGSYMWIGHSFNPSSPLTFGETRQFNSFNTASGDLSAFLKENVWISFTCNPTGDFEYGYDISIPKAEMTNCSKFNLVHNDYYGQQSFLTTNGHGYFLISDCGYSCSPEVYTFSGIMLPENSYAIDDSGSIRCLQSSVPNSMFNLTIRNNSSCFDYLPNRCCSGIQNLNFNVILGLNDDAVNSILIPYSDNTYGVTSMTPTSEIVIDGKYYGSGFISNSVTFTNLGVFNDEELTLIAAWTACSGGINPLSVENNANVQDFKTSYFHPSHVLMFASGSYIGGNVWLIDGDYGHGCQTCFKCPPFVKAGGALGNWAYSRIWYGDVNYIPNCFCDELVKRNLVATVQHPGGDTHTINISYYPLQDVWYGQYLDLTNFPYYNRKIFKLSNLYNVQSQRNEVVLAYIYRENEEDNGPFVFLQYGCEALNTFFGGLLDQGIHSEFYIPTCSPFYLDTGYVNVVSGLYLPNLGYSVIDSGVIPLRFIISE